MAQITTDICVIGAGSGGLSVTAGAVQMGARAVLVEGAEMGGDCLNFGCVPSKALLAAAKAAHAMGAGAGFGVLPVKPQVDFAAAKDHVAQTIVAIAPMDSQARFEGLGVRVIRAWGRFTSPAELEAGPDSIIARRFVIATGSRPRIPAILGLDGVSYLTNETIFALRERPAHLLIIGGGAVGVELAQAHRRLGSEVTLIEATRVLDREDPEAAAVVVASLRAEGVKVLEHAAVAKVTGNIIVTLREGGNVVGSHLLIAAGRQVLLDRLNPGAAGVAFTDNGITVDKRLRTSNRRIFAIGDAVGGAFTHVAAYHAGIVLRQAVLGLPAHARRGQIPRVIYTDPELAQVGLTEAEAQAKYGAGLTVQMVSYARSDRAVTDGHQGFLKLMVHRGRPVGVTIVGQQAGEIIQLWCLAIGQNLKLSAIAGMIAPYPTLGELSKRAASAYFSPKLFDNPLVKHVVRAVQRFLP